jgi:DNA-binding XRE family transcriptional regulator
MSGMGVSSYNRVREYRQILGLTQRQLAKAADVALPTLARLDAHRSALPSLKIAVRLARALGISLADLITDAPPQ